MAKSLPALENRVRDQRLGRGWSQDELARRSGLSRAGISAVETGRLVPSAAAALALASAFGVRVEDVFSLPRPAPEGAAWAWPPAGTPARYWQAEVGGRTRLYPAEPTAMGALPHDGVARGDAPALSASAHAPGADASATLVMACCDPAVGLLADALARAAGVRLLALPRSSRSALDLLGRGLVHAAGVHLAAAVGDGNAPAAAEALAGAAAGPVHLLRVATWDEGVVFDPSRPIGSVGSALRSRLRWVGREPGSGARQCLDELFDGRRPPRLQAHDHRGVAEAVRSGWADAGVCIRFAGEEAGLGFFAVRREAYDLCFADALRDDPRVKALVQAVRSSAYRRLLGDLPGYDSAGAGELRRVAPGGRSTA